MIDFDSRLTAVLDDIAESVRVRPDPDPVFLPALTHATEGVHRFRPSLAAVAAAGILLLGGSAFAMEQLASDPPSKVTPAAVPVTEATDQPTTTARPLPPTTMRQVEREVEVVTTPARVPVTTVAAVPELTVTPTEPTVPPTQPTEPTVPPTQPTVPPAVIEFTAKLGADGQANTPMTQGFSGRAQPGSAIRVGSDWGVAETVADPNGNWATTLVMPEVPPGTQVNVRITSSTSDRVREFTLFRPGEATPPVVAFTANAAQTTTDHTPPINEYWGTSTAGAVISITSDYGSKQVESNAEGKWSARLEFPDAPLSVTFNVHITSSKGEGAYDFPLTRVGPI